jgi:hypothetical protein
MRSISLRRYFDSILSGLLHLLRAPPRAAFRARDFGDFLLKRVLQSCRTDTLALSIHYPKDIIATGFRGLDLIKLPCQLSI